ncbi:FAD-dependent oxidoreductase [Roseomonas gilardii subsp. gilardii]|uniref:FAD-dependent oxidoreductase n=1 Tax=Roseomonas gilardii TaxID=257708 RepID=UPI001FFA0B08|nr:FAD-dependent oxidoreductase [Roseomonas gilardii]UPG71665.1 FAD-dependent oxidoreductase [Roseomonas gilardii subsp. gilardii]
MAMQTAETVIIGAGQAGVPLARALAEAGRDVLLIERDALGGSCVNFGCTPSKAVIASARLAAQARRAAEWGVRIPVVEVDFAAVMERARSLVAEQRGELEGSFRQPGAPRLLRGEARIEGREDGRFRIRVGEAVVLADRLVLDTGSRAAWPDLPGLEQVPLIDSRNWIELRERPGHLLFLGGGTIALELAQAYRRLGSAVTIIESGPQLTEREDPDVAEVLRGVLEAEGIAIYLGAKPSRAEAAGEGVRLHLEGRVLEGTHLFLAAGRQANTDALGLDSIGLHPGEKGILEVDDHLRTGVEGVFAVGDIRGGPQFTHTAYDDFRILESLFLGDGARTTQRIVPYAIFTEPELGRVGLSEREARESGRPYRLGRKPMTESGKARDIGRTEGFIKVLSDPGTGEILGAAALCDSGAEVVQLFVELMNARAGIRTMLDGVHIHPTLSEAAKNAVAALEGQS